MLAIGAALGLLFAFSLDLEIGRGEVQASTSSRVAAVRSLHQSLRTASEDAYHVDRSRRLYGQLVGIDGRSLDGQLVLVDQREHAARLEARIGHGLDAMLDLSIPALHTEQVAATPSGEFVIDSPPVGLLAAFTYAPGHAPRRQSNLAVADGFSRRGIGGALAPEQSKQIRLELPDDTVEVLPLYRSWWPDLSWTSLAREDGSTATQVEFEVNWRDPDGWPWGLAVRQEDTQVFMLDLEADPSAAVLPLRSSERWMAAPPEGSASGAPALWRDLELALSRAAHLVRAAPEIERDQTHGPETPTHGFIRVRAPRGHLPVELRTSTGMIHEAFADAWGELEFHSIPPGGHRIRAGVLGAGWTRWRGVHVSQGERCEISMGRVDEAALMTSADRVNVGGFLIDPASPNAVLGEADVELFVISGDPQVRRRLASTDSEGWFEFESIRRGATVELRFGRKGEGEHRSAMRFEVPDPTNGDVQPVSLIVPDTELVVSLPERSIGNPISDAALVQVYDLAHDKGPSIGAVQLAASRTDDPPAPQVSNEVALSHERVPTDAQYSDARDSEEGRLVDVIRTDGRAQVSLRGLPPSQYRVVLLNHDGLPLAQASAIEVLSGSATRLQTGAWIPDALGIGTAAHSRLEIR